MKKQIKPIFGGSGDGWLAGGLPACMPGWAGWLAGWLWVGWLGSDLYKKWIGLGRLRGHAKCFLGCLSSSCIGFLYNSYSKVKPNHHWAALAPLVLVSYSILIQK